MNAGNAKELLSRFEEEVARDERMEKGTEKATSPNSKPIAMGITTKHLAIFSMVMLIGVLLPNPWWAWALACVGAGALTADEIDTRRAAQRNPR